MRRNLCLIGIFSLVYIAICTIFGHLIVTESLFSNLYNGIDEEMASELFHFYKKWSSLGVVSILILFFVRIAIVPSIIYFINFVLPNSSLDGTVNDSVQKIGFADLLYCVLLAEPVYLLQQVFRTIYFYIYPPSDVYEYVSMPLSLWDILRLKGIDDWLLYALNILNVFELLYFFVLAATYKYVVKVSYKVGVSDIAKSYGLFFCLYVIMITMTQYLLL